MTIEIFAMTGKRHFIDLKGDELIRRERSPVGVRRQKGILTEGSKPKDDADVIMTAAIVGYAIERVKKGLNCQFTYEPDPNQEKAEADRKAHWEAITKINSVLVGAGYEAKAVLGETPVFSRALSWLSSGTNRIIGGTGDQPLDDPTRVKAPTPSGPAEELFGFATKDKTIRDRLGYQGRGAYTGFIDGRPDGQTALMSTFRFRAAEDEVSADPRWGSRWMPSDAQTPPIGLGRSERIWGMIATNWDQEKTAAEGMYFQDSDGERGWTGLNTGHIVGYVHGMIQAIYDVAGHDKGKGGTPYEIAVGKETTKLASCIPCTLFMEATGNPASAVHLGRGESWCILHPTGATSRLNTARQRCNDEWAAYCAGIVAIGAKALKDRIVATNKSLEPLLAFIDTVGRDGPQEGKADYRLANLILDAVTVHENEYKRINRTIALPPSTDSTGVKKNEASPAQTALPCQMGALKITLELRGPAARGDIVTVVVMSKKSGTGGTIQLDQGTTTVFTDLPPGEYEVSVQPSDGTATIPRPAEVPAVGVKRTYQVPTAGKATVEAKKTAEVTLRLRPWDWIEVAFSDRKKHEYDILLPGKTAWVSASVVADKPVKPDDPFDRFTGLPSGICSIRITT